MSAPIAPKAPTSISVRAASANNLARVDLDLPLGRWVSVVGPSGSGKTSLVFDTLVREGQRRYLGSLSPRARHYLGKLGRAQADELRNLPATIAVGQRTLTPNARSTVGTLTGALDLLRLLFARGAVDPQAGLQAGPQAEPQTQPLRRAHFSFNHPDGACPACGGLGLEDQVDPALLVADPTKSLRQGALRPTLKNGYTVYSQVTLDVMDQVCKAHGFDVDQPWADLSDAQRDVILYGSRALKVPFGKHSIESRMRWQGITARPREEGYYRGLVPVIQETLARDRNTNILRYVRSVPCSVCDGSRLARPGRQAHLDGTTLPQLLAAPTAQLGGLLEATVASSRGRAIWQQVRPSLRSRLDRMVRLGLGHLSLDRPSTSLSGGEAQRVRLAAQLSAGLSGQLLALDEPTLGLHPESQPGLQAVLQELLELGNSLVVVEHDPDMVCSAEDLVALGPGAGPAGGRIVYAGPRHQAPDADRPLGSPPPRRSQTRPATGRLCMHGASLHNLQDVDLKVDLGCFTVVTGPSGAGKSSLVFGTLLPALTGQPGGPFASLDGGHQPGVDRMPVLAVDASPIGRTPRSTPATWSGLFDGVRKRFAATPEARSLGLSASHFSFNSKAGRCPRCEGLGSLRIGLHLLEDIEQICPTCAGQRYRDDVLAVRLRGHDIAQVLALTMAQAASFFDAEPKLAAVCQAMDELGLGYLKLGQSSTTLSRGEAQRVKLATLIAKTLIARAEARPTLLLMDEPDRGLHPVDLYRLLAAIERLVDAGHTVLAISHHRHLWAAADRRIELREGALVTPTDLAPGAVAAPLRRKGPARLPTEIHLEGVCTHNLANVELHLPHRALTVIVGPSGSGKTSLAFDSLAAEATYRFSESLPFQVRRFVQRLPRPKLRAAHGLTPTLTLRQRQSRAGRRSTVATQSELGPLLRLLWSRAGMVAGQPCGLSAEHFSPDRSLGACPACEGLGLVARCSPDRLITHPTRSLLEGAMQGSQPGRFFGEPDGQYLATLQAVLSDVDLHKPWCELSAESQRTALYGSGEQAVSVTWHFQRGKRSGQHHFEGRWQGFCALVEAEARLRAQRKSAAAWTQPLVDQPCEHCGGSRLNPAARAVRLGGPEGPTLAELMALPLDQIAGVLDAQSGQSAVLSALWPELGQRLEDLCGLGLGHLSLDRQSRSLSDGELQRLRLANVLRAGMTGLTVVLDEPSAGLHRQDLDALITRLRQLVDAGNTVVVVDHRAELIRAADHLVELGPGAGPLGGEIVAQGPIASVLAGDSLTARALRRVSASPPSRGSTERLPGLPELRITGARAQNLQDVDLTLPGSGLVAITGVSGAGKSSLVFAVIEASARAGQAVGCEQITGLDRFVDVHSPRSQARTPLDALGLMAPLQALYASTSTLLPKRAFSFRSPAGRCPACQGSGRERIAMDFLADLDLPCVSCKGRRYRPEVLAVHWREIPIDALLTTPASQLDSLLQQPGPAHKAQRALHAGVAALIQVGLGHLSLGRSRGSLSGGEAQRLLLAQSLLLAKTPVLHLLDEPARGLHEDDLGRFLDVAERLAQRGDLLIYTAHRQALIDAADLVIELGPGGGPAGGRVMASAC